MYARPLVGSCDGMRDARCCGLGGVYSLLVLLLVVGAVAAAAGVGDGDGVGTDAAVERKRGRDV